jgi:AmiR/NasT family two-component response regulator
MCQSVAIDGIWTIGGRGTPMASGPDTGTMGAMTIRVFLLDDHELVREGIRSLLESDDDIEVVGEAATGEEALSRIPLAKPDVAILDVRLEEVASKSAVMFVHTSQGWPA